MIVNGRHVIVSGKLSGYEEILKEIINHGEFNSIENDKLNFFYFYNSKIKENKINVAFIDDIRIKQAAMYAYVPNILLKLNEFSITDVEKFSQLDYFITLNDYCAEEIKKWHRNIKPHSNFLLYPRRNGINGEKREEVVYCDYASTPNNNYLNLVLNFMHDIYIKYNIPGVIVSRHLKESWNKLNSYEDIKVIHEDDYDYLSSFGILIHSPDFWQYKEGIPRKLLVYLSNNITPLVPSSFLAVKKYLMDEGIEIPTYTSLESLENIFNCKLEYNPNNYTLNNRIHELSEILDSMEGTNNG